MLGWARSILGRTCFRRIPGAGRGRIRCHHQSSQEGRERAAVGPKQNLSAVFEQLLSGLARAGLDSSSNTTSSTGLFAPPTTMPSAPADFAHSPSPGVLARPAPKGSRSVKGLRPPERRHRSQQSPASRRASERDCEHRLEIRLEELANLVVVEGKPGRPETACVCTEIESAGADTRLELGGTIPA